MGPLLVVFPHPRIQAGSKFVPCPIDLLRKRHAVDHLQYRSSVNVMKNGLSEKSSAFVKSWFKRAEGEEDCLFQARIEDNLYLLTVEIVHEEYRLSLQSPVSYRRRNVTWIEDALDVDHDTVLLTAKKLQ